MDEKRATPRSGNYNGVKASGFKRDTYMIAKQERDYERGCLIAGLAMAVSFGMCFVNWWWFGC